MAGTRNVCVTASSRKCPNSVVGDASPAKIVVAPACRPAKPQLSAPTWKSGVASRLTLSACNPQRGVTPATLVARLRLVSITPLGRPLVPDVYTCRTTSSGADGAADVRAG